MRNPINVLKSLESTEDTEEYFQKQSGGHSKKVNKAVSFNAIKYRVLNCSTAKFRRKKCLQNLRSSSSRVQPSYGKTETQPAETHRVTNYLASGSESGRHCFSGVGLKLMAVGVTPSCEQVHYEVLLYSNF